MGSKRRADTELTKDNWDDEEEPENVGVFQKATDEVMKNRVIKTAKRRIAGGGGGGASDNEQKSIFSGFTGFANKVASNKAFSFTSGFGSDGGSGSTVSKPEFTFAMEKKTDNSPVSDSKVAGNTVVSKPPVISIVHAKPPQFSLCAKPKVEASKQPAASDLQIPLSTTSVMETQSKLNKLSKELKKTASEGLLTVGSNNDPKNDSDAKTEEDIFVQKLRSLNLLCAEWIIKHLNENLSYILTPIFDDYKKHLTQLREERQKAKSTCKMAKIEKKPEWPKASTAAAEPPSTGTMFKAPDVKQSLTKVTFGGKNSSSPFTSATNEEPKNESFKFNSFGETKVESNFKFSSFNERQNDAAPKPFEKNQTSLFKFGNQSESKEESKPASYFSFGNSNTNPSSAKPFFSQPAIPPKTDDSKVGETDEDQDRPPVIEDATITEEGSVYDKKCKVYIKKDGNFVDHGVGFLFLKLIGDEQKCQIIVRANNKLANIIINVLLTSSVPVQKMTKNNVMIICCPNAEVKQPTPVLIKVKTEDDAEELFNNLNKYKK